MKAFENQCETIIQKGLKNYHISFSESDSKDILVKKLMGISLDSKLNVKKTDIINRCKELGVKSTGSVNDLMSNLIENQQNIKNKGTGAGGKNTNKTGLLYEKLTNLIDKLSIINAIKSNTKTFNIIKFNNSNNSFIQLHKANLFNYMKMNNKLNINIKQAHGCKQPDECYIDETNKNIFIIEKKFQQRPGSVCEKIQTGPFKIWQYSRQFPDYNIKYLYKSGQVK